MLRILAIIIFEFYIVYIEYMGDPEREDASDGEDVFEIEDPSGNVDPSGNYSDCSGNCECTDGKDGKDGRDVRDGRDGVDGPRGPRGCPGPTGEKGDTGEVGPTGESLPNTFMSLYNLTPQVVAQEGNVLFDNNKVIFGSCDHVVGTGDMYFWQSGYYHIVSNLSHVEPCQFSMYLNGILVSGSTTGSPTGSTQNYNTTIVEIGPLDLITPTGLSPTGFAALFQVRNHTSFPTLGVQLDGNAGSGSETVQTNAEFLAILLSAIA
jgi:hypothetical protein